MRFLAGITILIVCAVLGYFGFARLKTESVQHTPSPVSPTVTRSHVQTRSALFVPYWSEMIGYVSDKYDRYIYFGVSPTTQGINTADEGYRKIKEFSDQDKGKTTLLTLRMTDKDENEAILHDTDAWPVIAEQLVLLAKQYQFNGVVLDLEVGMQPFRTRELTPLISSYVKYVSDYVKNQGLTFAVAIYGDSVYRSRPYDLKVINQSSDEVMVMAYDLHKAIGEPGPNFPLYGKEKWGYDLTKLVDDMQKDIAPEKLTIIFGMYGYDWAVNEKKIPLKAAEPLSYLEIKNKYIKKCGKDNCVIRRDDKAMETEMNFVFTSYDPVRNYYTSAPRVIWYEDETSSEKKMYYLQSRGISSVAYWAYGYY